MSRLAWVGVALVIGTPVAVWLSERPPDSSCVWLADDVAPRPPCLLDAKPPHGCVKMDFVYAHQLICANVERLAAFTEKNGRRLCGQATQQCTDVVQ